jgi:nucleotide-binding universal stress UspA family protein
MKPLIIVCTDFSPCSDVAVARAADIAARDDVRVFLLHTYDPKRVKGPAAYAPTERDRHGWDEESMRQLKGVRHEFFAGLPDTDVQYDAVPSESPSIEICRIARETHASLIVMGSHGRTGMLRRLLGSVAEATVRHAPCSVFVVRDSTPQER